MKKIKALIVIIVVIMGILLWSLTIEARSVHELKYDSIQSFIDATNQPLKNYKVNGTIKFIYKGKYLTKIEVFIIHDIKPIHTVWIRGLKYDGEGTNRVALGSGVKIVENEPVWIATQYKADDYLSITDFDKIHYFNLVK
jgi:hypothetical protein